MFCFVTTKLLFSLVVAMGKIDDFFVENEITECEEESIEEEDEENEEEEASPLLNEEEKEKNEEEKEQTATKPTNKPSNTFS